MSTTASAEWLLLEVDAGELRGPVVIRLRPDLAPRHVARIRELAAAGAYDGVAFHRVIEGFMAQTGDVEHGNLDRGWNPRLAGTGGSGLGDLPAEFTPTPFRRGTVGMARTPAPDSANSQFFIMFAPAPHLDGQYTVWGEVVRGMEIIDALPRGQPPARPGRILRAELADRPPAEGG